MAIGIRIGTTTVAWAGDSSWASRREAPRSSPPVH
jgi:hypothetical protein